MSGKQLHTALSTFLSPLRALLLVVAVVSACGGAAGTCMAFITSEAFGLGDRENLTLQLVAGLVYTVTALGIGPLLRFLALRARRLSRRTVLGILILGWAASYFIAGGSGFFPQGRAGEAPGGEEAGALTLAVALFALGYCLSFASSGAAWPIIQAYAMGGKSGSRLRRALGEFNMTWSAGLPIGVFGLGAVVEVAPLEGVLAAGVLVAAMVLPLALLPPAPGRHGEAPEPVTPIYRPLVRVFRALLPMGVLLAFVLYPIAPTLTAELGLSPAVGAILLAVLHLFRFLIFLVMRYWHGWHGRWRTVLWSGALLFGGFAAILLAHTIWLLVLGLAAFGTAIGATYCAAMYYGQALGNTEVEAGGKHEALIGCGFVFGPLAALVPLWLNVSAAWRTEAILLSSLLACGLASYWVIQPAYNWFRAQRAARGAGETASR